MKTITHLLTFVAPILTMTINDLVKFSNESLTVNGFNPITFHFTVVSDGTNDENIYVSFQAPGYDFDQCQIVHPQREPTANYSVKIKPTPSAQLQPVPLSMEVYYPGNLKSVETVSTLQTFLQPVNKDILTCSVYSSGHTITDASGTNTENIGFSSIFFTGSVYLVKTAWVDIQVSFTQGPLIMKPINMIAIRYYSEIYIFQQVSFLNVTKQAVNPHPTTVVTPLFTGYKIAFSDGASMTIQPTLFGLSVTTLLPYAHFERFSGLCDKKTLADPLSNFFVPDAENLFIHGTNSTVFADEHQITEQFKSCSLDISRDDKEKLVSQMKVDFAAMASKIAAQSKIIAPPVNPIATLLSFKKTALDLCNQLLYINECHGLVDASSFVSGCLQGVLVSGNLSFFDSARTTLVSTCILKASIEKDQQNVMTSIGQNMCSGGCGNGICRDLGCVCDQGFTGTACSISTQVDSSAVQNNLTVGQMATQQQFAVPNVIQSIKAQFPSSGNALLAPIQANQQTQVYVPQGGQLVQQNALQVQQSMSQESSTGQTGQYDSNGNENAPTPSEPCNQATVSPPTDNSNQSVPDAEILPKLKNDITNLTGNAIQLQCGLIIAIIPLLVSVL